MSWSGEHRGFVVEVFFKNNDSVTATQRAFRTLFGLYATDAVPDRKTILRWVSNVRASGSASMEQSPRRSARKHVAVLGISDRTVRL